MTKQDDSQTTDTSDSLCEDHAWVLRREAGSYILVSAERCKCCRDLEDAHA